MAQSKGRSKSRIPEFASREEAAAWFDTHDMADYQDEFKTVRMRLANNLTRRDHRFASMPETLVGDATAPSRKEKGIGLTTPARLWIKERSHRHEAPTPA